MRVLKKVSFFKEIQEVNGLFIYFCGRGGGGGNFTRGLVKEGRDGHCAQVII